MSDMLERVLRIKVRGDEESLDTLEERITEFLQELEDTSGLSGSFKRVSEIAIAEEEGDDLAPDEDEEEEEEDD